jgi:2-oxoglutarate ferredoxin oxidoreductase subunit beta
LHGRALPVAVGAKLANKDLTVIAVAGDGDQYGEGGNHLLHTARYNADVNLIVANNQSFSLTTGQASPTSDLGYVSKTTPWGEIKQPINPMALSLSAGATFVARSLAFDPKHLVDTIKSAILHKGFSHVDVLQQCVTFNKVNTIAWYKEHTYLLEDTHNSNNFEQAMKKASEHEKMSIGILYQTDKPVYGEQLRGDRVMINEQVLFDKSLLKEFK